MWGTLTLDIVRDSTLSLPGFYKQWRRKKLFGPSRVSLRIWCQLNISSKWLALESTKRSWNTYFGNLCQSFRTILQIAVINLAWLLSNGSHAYLLTTSTLMCYSDSGTLYFSKETRSCLGLLLQYFICLNSLYFNVKAFKKSWPAWKRQASYFKTLTWYYQLQTNHSIV